MIAMSLRLEQVLPEEQNQVIAFLREVFHAPQDALFLESDHVRWRFFDPHPDWNGSRSYVFRDEGRIVAHGGVVPTTFIRPSGEILKSLSIIDWAASPAYPGFGILMSRELGALSDFRVSYGGSADARAVLTKAHSGKGRNFTSERAIGEMLGFDRATRPLSFLRDRTIPTWRACARAGRAFYRNFRRPLKSTGPWKAHPVERFDTPLSNATTRSSQCGLMLPLRSKELLNYMLDCPSVSFKGFLLEKEGSLCGHLLLAARGQEVRVADLVIDSDRVEDWIACYTLAASWAAREFPSASRLRLVGALDFQKKALFQIGFSEESRARIYAYDPHQVLADEEVPLLNMMDNDAAYLF